MLATALPSQQSSITFYFIVTRLPDSIRAVRDHFLALDPTALTVDLLEQHLLAAESSVIAVGAARGTPRTPFFEGCSPSPLAPSYASTAAADVLGAEDVGAASASGKRRSSKGKGGRGGGGGSGGGGGGSSGGGGGSGGGGSSGSGGGSGGFGGGGGGSGGGGSSGGNGSGGSRAGATQRGGSGGGKRQQQQRRSETPSGVAIFDLDYDAILAAMYALSVSAEGDCYQCVPPDPGIEAAALGASESVLPGTVPAEALHTSTLDSGASRCFFRDSTTLTSLSAPVPVMLANPFGGPVLARSSTLLPCLSVPSGSLSGLHLPSFSMNLVSTAALQDAMVTATTPGALRVSICTCTRMGRHLATFTRRPGSSLYTLATEPPQVAASAQVSESGSVEPPCSCHLLSHQTLLWHHRLGHPSLPRLRGMHSRLLVSGRHRSLPPLLPSPAPPCLPCVEGQQRAAPHSPFPSTTDPLQTLHMDVWGPACVSGQGRERYSLLFVDDCTHYTTVFPLSSKGEVPDVLIPWIRAVRLHLRERFRADLLILRLHSDRGGEFSYDLLRDFCREEGILQSFTLPASPQQNGIAERRIGLVMEVARTSMIHAAAPHFLWLFAVRYAAHQLNIWPLVSLPETTLTLRLTGEVEDASVFWVWGSLAFVRDTSADKLFARAIPCIFLGFPLDAPGWQFYHPTSRRVFPSHDITFDESVPFYHLFPYRSAPPPPPPLFLAPGPPPVDPLPPQGPAPSGVSQVDPLPGTVPFEVGVGLGAARGAASGGAESGGAEPGDVDSEGARSREGAEFGGAELRGTASSGGPASSSPRLSSRLEPLSPQQLREWFAQRTCLRSGAARAGDSAAGDTGAGGIGATRFGGAGFTAVASGTGGAAAAGPGGARTRGTGVARTGSVGGARAGGAAAGGAGAGDPGAVGAGAGGTGAHGAGVRGAGAGGAVSRGTGPGGTVRPRAYFVPLLQQVLGLPSSTALTPPLLCPPPGSPPSFKARYIARKFSKRQGIDYFHTFSPTPKMTTLRVLLHVAAWRDYELHSLDFRTPFLQSSLHEEIWLHLPPGFTGSFPADPSLFLRTDTSLPPFYVLVYVNDLVFATAHTEALTLVKSELQKRHICTDLGKPRNYLGLQITRERARSTITLTQSHMVHQVLQRFGFQFSSPQPTPLSTCTRPELAYHLSLLARYVAPGRHRKLHEDAAKRVLRYLCSTSGMGLVLGGRGPVVLTGQADASWVDDSATQRSSQGYTFGLGSGSVSWRSTRSSLVLSSSCEAEIYAGAMAV
ncbi:unnamed protein product [Closterium sp. NIES-54]